MELHWTALTVLVLLFTQISRYNVDSAGQLHIRLVSFTNPGSLLADGGRCCQSPNSIDDTTCTGPCRTFFRVCASADGAGIPLQSPVRLSRISRLRSRRGRRSPSPLAQLYTDTAVPSGLPPIGDEDELLPAEHRTADGGTAIQVIHHLISTAEEEPTGAAGADRTVPTARSTEEGTEPQVFPLEHSAGLPEDTDNAASSDSPVAVEDSINGGTTADSSPLEGSALVGRPSSQGRPVDPQDIGIVFVEDADYIHLYFQPSRRQHQRGASGGSAGDPPRHSQPGRLDVRHRRSVRTASLDDSINSDFENIDDLLSSPDHLEDLAGEGSGSEEPEEEVDTVAAMESTSSRRGMSARQDEVAPQTTAECPLGVLFTAVVTNSSLESTGHISFPFDTLWPGRLNLVVEAWHDVTGALEPSTADFSQLGPDPAVRLISRAVLRRPLTADSWSDDVISAGPGRLEVQSRVVCSAGSGGPHCATACDLKAGSRGHWRCLEDGSVTCRAGWRGAACDQPVCRTGCSQRTGYCRVPGECLCKIGYHGELCSQCVPLPGCRHGVCKRSFECRCREGWTGLFCNKPICAKGCDKDRGYCTRPNECRCREGWRGSRCDQCERLPGCRHGTCDRPMECRCRHGWTGFLCERAICREGCSRQHGYCERPSVCRCALGWHGDLCDTCLPYPGCLHGNCSEPWQCVCQPGWTGFLCDKPTEPCSHHSDLCQNGGTCEVVLEEGLPTARCRCSAGFSGATCEEVNTLQLSSSASSRAIATSRAVSGTGVDSSSSSRAGGSSSSRWPWGRPHVTLGVPPVRPHVTMGVPPVRPDPLLWRHRRLHNAGATQNSAFLSTAP